MFAFYQGGILEEYGGHLKKHKFATFGGRQLIFLRLKTLEGGKMYVNALLRNKYVLLAVFVLLTFAFFLTQYSYPFHFAAHPQAVQVQAASDVAVQIPINAISYTPPQEGAGYWKWEVGWELSLSAVCHDEVFKMTLWFNGKKRESNGWKYNCVEGMDKLTFQKYVREWLKDLQDLPNNVRLFISKYAGL